MTAESERELRRRMIDGHARELRDGNRMTALTRRPQLAEMRIRVTRRARRRGRRETDALRRVGRGARRRHRLHVTLRAGQRGVLPGKEGSRIRVGERLHGERAHRMALLAQRAQLAAMHIGVTGAARGLQTAEVLR